MALRVKLGVLVTWASYRWKLPRTEKVSQLVSEDPRVHSNPTFVTDKLSNTDQVM